MIEVEQLGEGEPMSFQVTVREGSGETHHRVTMSQADYMRLTAGKVAAEKCIETAFAFLLKREPKESILSHFDITVILRYFPDFGQRVGSYLS